MWTIDTPWFDVATFMSLYAVGVILFGHFEFHKPAWRRLLKAALFLAMFLSLAHSFGRADAYGAMAALFALAGCVHFWQLAKHGINGWTGEPRDRYVALVGPPRGSGSDGAGTP